MERREEALREALINNAEERARWEAYQKENQVATENLEMFSKRLVVDVMVPLGRKAYTAGQLVHTNEVLVSHYQGYFSKCSAETAKQICELRLRMAKEHLEKLQMEADLWNNKLEKPYLEGVLPSSEQREIIEEYDEEKEKLWREEHKLRVKQSKLREKEMLAKEKEVQPEKNTDDIVRMLEEAEQMEELKNELDSLQLEGDTDEILQKLMQGELKLPPPKQREAHMPKPDEVKFDSKVQRIVKKAELEAISSPPTNNNVHVNPELLQAVEEANGGNESDDSDDSDVPEEAQSVAEQAKYLPAGDQIGFYEYHLQIIEQKILTLSVTNATEIEQKLRLFKVRDCLHELIEEVEESEGALELAAAEKTLSETDEAKVVKNSSNQQQNKRISFALEDHTLEFRKTEVVAEMLPKVDAPAPKRDIIKLDGTVLCSKPSEQTLVTSLSPVDKKERVLRKVEENRNYVAEQQSVDDFDLVNKIISSAEEKQHTLHIHFKHSAQEAVPEVHAAVNGDTENDGADKIPGSPADVYRLFGQKKEDDTPQQPQILFVDAYEGEDQVKVPVLKEQDRKEAYKDLRTEFSQPDNVTDSGAPAPPTTHSSVTKSILKNKSAVKAETHLANIRNTKTKTTNTSTKKREKPRQKSLGEEEYMSAYDLVMGDVVEKPLLQPDPLPEGKYIDAIQPKKRISRFKQMRTGIQTT